MYVGLYLNMIMSFIVVSWGDSEEEIIVVVLVEMCLSGG